MKRSRRSALLAALLFVLAAPPEVQAAPGDAAAAAPAAKKKKKDKGSAVSAGDPTAEAKRLFREGDVLFDSGQFDKALAAYTASYEAKPLPAILVNIAQCHRNLGNYERSIFFYKKYLAEVPDSPLKDAIVEVVSEMEEKHAVATKAEGARVAASKAEAELLTEVERKTRAELEARKATEGATAARLTAEAEKLRLEAARKKMFYKRPWFWMLIGGLLVGGGLAATGLVLTAPPDPGSLGRWRCWGCAD